MAMSRVLLSATILVLGCEASGPGAPVPDGWDWSDADCDAFDVQVSLHPALDTLDLDYGATVAWAWEPETVVWNEGFPRDGVLGDRVHAIHRTAFPLDLHLCLPPGEWAVRVVLDLNHNGWICEPGEYWGVVESVTQPAPEAAPTPLSLADVIAPEDGCLSEMAVPVSR